MPPRLPHVTASTVAGRMARHPETISLANAQAIYAQLAERADLGSGRHTGLGGWLRDLVLFIQGLIDTPVPAGLVAYVRMLKDADDLIGLAQEAHSDMDTCSIVRTPCRRGAQQAAWRAMSVRMCESV